MVTRTSKELNGQKLRPALYPGRSGAAPQHPSMPLAFSPEKLVGFPGKVKPGCRKA